MARYTPSRLTPKGKMTYEVLLADPPWQYNIRMGGVQNRTQFKKSRFGVGVHRYQTMKTSEIRAMPVKNLASDSAILFLWVTWPFLEDGLSVVKAWGFDYKTVGFLWVKTNPKKGTPFFGVGFYSKSNTEPCLLATRGKTMKPATNAVSSLIIAPRQEHSRKPAETRTRIEQMYPNARRLELFARERVAGWDAFGNEVESDVRIDQPTRFEQGGPLFAETKAR